MEGVNQVLDNAVPGTADQLQGGGWCPISRGEIKNYTGMAPYALWYQVHSEEEEEEDYERKGGERRVLGGWGERR